MAHPVVSAALVLSALATLAGCPQKKAGIGVDGGPTTYPGNPVTEKTELTDLGKALLSFYADTGGWPFGDTAWYAITPTWRRVMDTQLDGHECTIFDTALFAQPPDIVACDATHKGGYLDPCWRGPYSAGGPTQSLGTDPYLDQWGHPRMYAYIRPDDGNGGGIHRPGDAKGLIFIWSKGKDNVDGFLCTDGACAVDIDKEVVGLPSQAGADDIIVLVGSATE